MAIRPRVLFLCTENSCRTQMAEALLREMTGDEFDIVSAGGKAGCLDLDAVAAMPEVGIDISSARTKVVNPCLRERFHYVITLCNRESERSCPVFPGATWHLVKQTAGTIGYLELGYAKANGVPVASIQNAAGEFVSPTPAATAAAIEAFRDALAKDSRNSIADPPSSAKNAYPISGLSFALLRKEQPSEEQQRAIRDFVAYVISSGQELAEDLSYSKLPDSLRNQGQQLLSQLTTNAQPVK